MKKIQKVNSFSFMEEKLHKNIKFLPFIDGYIIFLLNLNYLIHFLYSYFYLSKKI